MVKKREINLDVDTDTNDSNERLKTIYEIHMKLIETINGYPPEETIIAVGNLVAEIILYYGKNDTESLKFHTSHIIQCLAMFRIEDQEIKLPN